MKNFINHVRSSTIQLLINQCGGFFIFFMLSRHLSKTEFGDINWVLAFYLLFFNILPFGLEQISVKKISAGESVPNISAAYCFHLFVTGTGFYILVFLIAYIFPGIFPNRALLLLLGFGKLLFLFSTPFKQIITGLEKFNLLLCMSIASTLAKLIGLSVLNFYGALDLHRIIIIFVLADGLEMCLSFIIYRYFSGVHLSLLPGKKIYITILKESLPQAGVSLFSSALSRLDWIIIGLFLSSEKVGEYSFAYKVFELSTFPLLIVAPLLVPIFSRHHKKGNNSQLEQKKLVLVKIEMVIACFTALLLNLLWIPVIDPLTHGLYGQANSRTIFFLSLSIPLLYLNNFLWSHHFSEGKLKMILRIFAITFLINLAGNIAFIPFYKNEGAALVFFISILLQTIFYSRSLKNSFLPEWQSLIICSVAALFSGWLSTKIFYNPWVCVTSAVTIYFLLLIPASKYTLKGIKSWSKPDLFKQPLNGD